MGRSDVFQGFLPVYKTAGKSSFAVVRDLRRVTGVKKIGHAGTLDPFAEGVLLMAIGRDYTRQISSFVGLPKTYWLRMVLGKTTSTFDPEGEVEDRGPVTGFSQAGLEDVLAGFQGDIEQVPPAFSAKKVNGKRAYALARQGKDVVLEPAAVTLFSSEILDVVDGTYPEVTLRIHCSKGFYVRSLVRDVAEKLGTVGYTLELIREAIGDIGVEGALRDDNFSPEGVSESLFTSTERKVTV